MTVRSLIIDDEPHARHRLRKLLEQHPLVEIVAEETTGEEAVAAIDRLLPDLVFLDIELPDFDAFEVLRRVEHPPAVIFTTGFNQYAVQAFEAAGIDYLLKPVEPEHLARALERLTVRNSPSAAAAEADSFDQRVKALLHGWEMHHVPRSFLERIAVRLGERILLIEVHDITHFYAKEKYVFARTFAGREYTISQTIADLEEQLDPQVFVRVHRSTLVNVKQIKEIQIWFGGKYRLVLADKEASEVVVSKNMAKRLKTVIPF